MAYSERNSTQQTINANATWTGLRDSVADWSSAVTLVMCDKAGQLLHQYSATGTDDASWIYESSFAVEADTSITCRSNVAGRYFRAKFTNSTAENGTLTVSTTYKSASDPAAPSSVEVTALPAIEIAAGQEVALAVGATVALAAGSAVSISPGSDVGLAAGATVALAAGSEVALAAGTSVDIGSLPAITIAGGQEVALAAGTQVALAAGSEVALAAGTEVGLAAGAEVSIANNLTIGSMPDTVLAAGSQILVSYKDGLKCRRSLAYTATGQLVRDMPCSLYGFCLQNLSPSNDCYVKFYNMASPPASTDTPFATYYLKAEATLDVQIAQGIALDSGIGIRVTDALGDSDNTDPAGTVIGTVHYL